MKPRVEKVDLDAATMTELSHVYAGWRSRTNGPQLSESVYLNEVFTHTAVAGEGIAVNAPIGRSGDQFDRLPATPDRSVQRDTMRRDGSGPGEYEARRETGRTAAGSAGVAQSAADAVSEHVCVDRVLFVHGCLVDIGNTLAGR